MRVVQHARLRGTCGGILGDDNPYITGALNVQAASVVSATCGGSYGGRIPVSERVGMVLALQQGVVLWIEEIICMRFFCHGFQSSLTSLSVGRQGGGCGGEESLETGD